MQIIFACNQHRTIFYDALARTLELSGVQVFWLTLSRRWTEFLAGRGWPGDRILDLSRHLSEACAQTPSADQLARLERIDSTAQVGLRHVLMVDRELRLRDGTSSLSWAAAVAGPIEAFLERNAIDFGCGEITWAHELLLAEILRHRGGTYWSHATIRIPSQRVALFPGVLHTHVEQIADSVDSHHHEIARQAIQAVRDCGQKPFYLKSSHNPVRFRRHWLEEAFVGLSRGLNRFDHTYPPLPTRALRRLMARARQLRTCRTYERPSADRPYVLVTLHKQPEASVDVAGYSMSNQVESIRSLARLLPVDWQIWVKEHAVATGDRSKSWYRELKRIPGVVLVAPELDTLPLMQGAQLVAAVTGTACFEAGVLGIPAITFAPIYFAPALVADHVVPAAMTRAEMDDLLARASCLRHSPELAQRVEQLVASLVANSVEGLAADPVNYPAAIEPSNLEAIADMTIKGLRRRQEHRTPQQHIFPISPSS
jgi:hypothetical protein